MPPENDENSTPEQSDGALGEAGKKAIAAERARAAAAERERQAVERERDALTAELTKLREASQSDSEKAIERARREAVEQTRKEITATTNRRLVVSEIRAAAGGRLTDPLDAVRLLDVDSFKVSDDGDVDDKAITKAIDELLTAKPYLASGSKRVEGSADAGARPASKNGHEPTSGVERLRNAYSQT